MFAKMNSIVRNMDSATRDRRVAEAGPLAAWATDPLTKQEKAALDEWGSLDLRSMAKKRDALPPIADTLLAKESLASSYEAVYSQFSSVAHYDRFSIELLGLHGGPNGEPMLSTMPYWPTVLLVKNALFDLIQCSEAAQLCYQKDAAQKFEKLFVEWVAVSDQIVPR